MVPERSAVGDVREGEDLLDAAVAVRRHDEDPAGRSRDGARGQSQDEVVVELALRPVGDELVPSEALGEIGEERAEDEVAGEVVDRDHDGKRRVGVRARQVVSWCDVRLRVLPRLPCSAEDFVPQSIDTRRMRPIPTALTLVLLAGTARADVPPDPNSIEAHCTLAEQCPDGVACPAGAHEDAAAIAACSVAQEGKGLQRRCNGGSIYSGVALYCRPDAHGSWSPPHAGGGCSRCTVAPERASSGVAAMAGTVLALLLFRRRARGRRAAPTN